MTPRIRQKMRPQVNLIQFIRGWREVYEKYHRDMGRAVSDEKKQGDAFSAWESGIAKLKKQKELHKD